MSDVKKIFISWSKARSKQVAIVLKEYLPKILDSVTLFMSDRDIDPGERSMKTIEAQLDGTSCGLLVVTAENQGEAWLNFEAGALSKFVGKDADDVPRVVPLLVDIDPSQLVGPISQFQATKLNREGLERTMLSIAALVGSNAGDVKTRFNWAWHELEEKLAGAKETVAQPIRKRNTEEKIDEALEILRLLQRRIPAPMQQEMKQPTAHYDSESGLTDRELDNVLDVLLNLQEANNMRLTKLPSGGYRFSIDAPANSIPDIERALGAAPVHRVYPDPKSG